MSYSFDFTKFRLMIDDAITYDDIPKAKDLAQVALEAARRAERLEERFYFTAQLLIIEEDFAGALKYLDLAITHNPADGASYNDRALCMIELGQLEGAMEYFDRGIDVEADFATIHHNKGWFLNQLGRHAEALVCFQKALELDPKRAVTFENIADCFFHMGRMADAVGAYKTAISLLESRCVDIREELEKRIKILQTKQ